MENELQIILHSNFFTTKQTVFQNPNSCTTEPSTHTQRGAHHQNSPETNTGRNKTTCNLSATNPTNYKEKDFYSKIELKKKDVFKVLFVPICRETDCMWQQLPSHEAFSTASAMYTENASCSGKAASTYEIPISFLRNSSSASAAAAAALGWVAAL